MKRSAAYAVAGIITLVLVGQAFGRVGDMGGRMGGATMSGQMSTGHAAMSGGAMTGQSIGGAAMSGQMSAGHAAMSGSGTRTTMMNGGTAGTVVYQSGTAATPTKPATQQ